MAAQELQCRAHVAAIVDALPRGSTVNAIAEIGTPFAVRTQLSWLGWPADLEGELVEWMADNFAATRSGDRARTAEVAARFDALLLPADETPVRERPPVSGWARVPVVLV